MKFATLPNGRRDGQVHLVSRDLTRAFSLQNIVTTLQQILDDWAHWSTELSHLSHELNAGQLTQTIPFDLTSAMAPLPRAYQWADGSAYVNHVELVRKARGATMPEQFWQDPLMYQGGSDQFLGACDPIEAVSEDHGIDFEAEVVAVTGDVPMQASAEQAGQQICLFMLVNDVSLRNLIPNELQKGFGFFQSKPACSFAPVAITPDELGEAYRQHQIHLPLHCHLNHRWFGSPHCGTDMTFNFAQLIAHAAHTRHLGAGTLVGSGTISNIDREQGSACLAEKRMLETLQHGQPQTPFMRFGDHIHIEMLNDQGESLFGAINQTVVRYEPCSD